MQTLRGRKFDGAAGPEKETGRGTSGMRVQPGRREEGSGVEGGDDHGNPDTCLDEERRYQQQISDESVVKSQDWKVGGRDPNGTGQRRSGADSGAKRPATGRNLMRPFAFDLAEEVLRCTPVCGSRGFRQTRRVALCFGRNI